MGGGADDCLGLGKFYRFGLCGVAHRRLGEHCYLGGITLGRHRGNGAWLERQIHCCLDIDTWYRELDGRIGVGINGDAGITKPAQYGADRRTWMNALEDGPGADDVRGSHRCPRHTDKHVVATGIRRNNPRAGCHQVEE